MTNTDSTDNARGPERIWADTDGVWREFDPSDFKTVVGEYIRSDLAPDPQDARVAVLVKAASEQLLYMDMCNDKGDLERNLRRALAAFDKGGKDAD